MAQGGAIETRNNTAIYGSGDVALNIDGTVHANRAEGYPYSTHGLYLDADALDLNVSETGSITTSGDLEGGAVFDTIHEDSTIVNNGTITTERGPDSIWLMDGDGDTNLYIGNSGITGDVGYRTQTGDFTYVSQGGTAGVITAEFTAHEETENTVYSRVSIFNRDGDPRSTAQEINIIRSSESNTSVTVSNTGTIHGDVNISIDGDPATAEQGNVSVLNDGIIEGNVNLGEGGDDYGSPGAGQVLGIVQGGAGSNAFNGGTFNDRFYGGADRDRFIASSGNDLLNGGHEGDNVDRVNYYNITRNDITFTRNADGSVQAVSERYDTDTLIDIENIKFIDFNTHEEEVFTLEELISGPTEPVDTNVVQDIVNETQYLTDAEGDGIFSINAPAADYNWGPTEDGTGIVVWNKETGVHDILWQFETISFTDQTVTLPDLAHETQHQNIIGETQYLFGDEGYDTFIVNAPKGNYRWNPTEDNEGIVIWDGEDFDLLYDFEEIQFTDGEYGI